MVEILAPAGSMEHLRAAVAGGADGVYLGTKEFSARQNAENFTLEQLKEAVNFCHERSVCVYVAVNTVIKNSELSGIAELAKTLNDINVDGIIIQDLGVAEIFRSVSPKMPLHASTQMAIHNLEGAKLLKSLGFSRVVLARELSFDEIAKITAECRIETEVFIHGAHCMSASGMCYLSSFIGGRSGNRGRCAQPCRLDFKVGKEHNCLSLKDMCYGEYIEKLKLAGVSSLKIEGRMKRPEYAYIASKTFKKAVLCENNENEMRLLKNVFSRSGFTSGYISGKLGKEMFGFRKKEDVEVGAAAVKEIGKMEESRKIPVYSKVEIKKDNPLKLTFYNNELEISVFSDEIITDKTKLPPVERIESSIKKMGGTPFEVVSFEVISEFEKMNEVDSESIPFPISSLNSLRRKGACEFSSAFSQRPKNQRMDYSIPSFESKKRECSEVRIRLENAEQGMYIEDFDGKIIIPIWEAEKLIPKFEKSQIIGELPFLVYPNDEEKILKELKKFKDKGFSSVLCENIAFVHVLREMGFSVYGGAYMNVINPLSLLQYEKLGVCDMTLSVETNAGDFHSFGNACKIGVITYGFVPLMQFRVCPVKAHLGCEKCGGNAEITDRLNNKFKVLCKGKFVSLLNTVPLSLSDKKMSVDFQTLYFTKESPKRVKEVLRSFLEGAEPDYPHTKGLYFRKVL